MRRFWITDGRAPEIRRPPAQRPAPSDWACPRSVRRRSPTRRPRQDVPDDRPRFRVQAADLEAAERRVAGEIDPGRRAMVVAILVFVLVLSFVFPHTGAARGVDVLMASDTASAHRIALPSRIFCWFALIFGRPQQPR